MTAADALQWIEAIQADAIRHCASLVMVKDGGGHLQGRIAERLWEEADRLEGK